MLSAGKKKKRAQEKLLDFCFQDEGRMAEFKPLNSEITALVTSNCNYVSCHMKNRLNP